MFPPGHKITAYIIARIMRGNNAEMKILKKGNAPGFLLGYSICRGRAIACQLFADGGGPQITQIIAVLFNGQRHGQRRAIACGSAPQSALSPASGKKHQSWTTYFSGTRSQLPVTANSIKKAPHHAALSFMPFSVFLSNTHGRRSPQPRRIPAARRRNPPRSAA